MSEQQKIGKFKLKNDGGFVVRMDAQYRQGNQDWKRVNLTNNILLGENVGADPGNHGVPNGADVRLYANITAGNDKVADEIYTYKTGNNHVAKYLISGTTENATLALIE